MASHRQWRSPIATRKITSGALELELELQLELELELAADAAEAEVSLSPPLF